MLPLSPLVATILVGLALSLTTLLLLARRRQVERRLHSERIGTMQRKIEAALGDEETVTESFSASLRAASLTTSLQRPRLETLAKVDKQPPDKYRILSNLAAQGMEVEEIATILGISRVEAGQLISLSTMAKIGR